MLAWQYCLIKSNLKCVWHKILYLLVRKSFQNDGERGLFYRDCSLCCRVIQGFDLCKLDYLWRHMVDTKWCKITRNGTSLKHFCIELKLLEFLYSLPTAMIWPIVTFPWQCNGLWLLSIQKNKIRVFLPNKGYLLLMFIQWVWANMDITHHKHKEVC